MWVCEVCVWVCGCVRCVCVYLTHLTERVMYKTGWCVWVWVCEVCVCVYLTHLTERVMYKTGWCVWCVGV